MVSVNGMAATAATLTLGPDASPLGGIWQVDLTGRNERRLPTPVGASDPAWGPVLP
jgi:hypothetical protein